MKRHHIAHCLSIAVLAFLAPQAVQAQAGGSLTPAGPPGKAMKSLDEVEPRTPLIDGEPGVSIDGNGTITISQSGSYSSSTSSLATNP